MSAAIMLHNVADQQREYDEKSALRPNENAMLQTQGSSAATLFGVKARFTILRSRE